MMQIQDFEQIFTRTRVSHTLEVLDDSCTTFKIESIFSIRAELRSRFFLRRFMWTGSEHDEEPELETKQDKWGHAIHNIHGPVIREEAWRIILVDLGRTLEIGEEDRVHFHHRLKDLNGKFQPFLAHRPTPGTEEIQLTVILPISMAIDVRFEDVIVDTGKALDIEKLVGIRSGETMTYHVKVESPVQLNRSYRIVWKHPRD